MHWKEIYIRFLSYIAILFILGQTITNIVLIDNKTTSQYISHVIVEGFYCIISISFFFMIRTWSIPLKKPRLSECNIEEKNYPKIDVLIPCYNEDIKLIEETLQKATQIKYPQNLHNIYLLDDSKRPELKHICNKLSITYITRNENKFQKPGNLNNLLNMQENNALIESMYNIPNPLSANLTPKKISNVVSPIHHNIIQMQQKSLSQTHLNVASPDRLNMVSPTILNENNEDINNDKYANDPFMYCHERNLQQPQIYNYYDRSRRESPHSLISVSSESPHGMQKKYINIEHSDKDLPSHIEVNIDVENSTSLLSTDNSNQIVIDITKHTSHSDQSQSSSLNNKELFDHGDYIIVLDCDMKPEYDIFDVLVPYLFEKDENNKYNLDHQIGFVQARQYYHNITYDTDYYDGNNSIYFNLIMPAMNTINNTPYVGTNGLISRDALKKIGFFFEGHATEDTITSMLLCSEIYKDKKTYKSIYVPDEQVAFGFSPETLAEAFDQRLRWVKGNVQLIMNNFPACIPTLSFQQKLAWIVSNMFWVFGIIFLGQYFTHIKDLVHITFNDNDLILENKLLYQLSLLSQLIFYLLLPNVTLLEKLRSLQMFVCYIPVYLFAFLNHICGCFKFSIVSNKGKQRKFHMLFIFHIVILSSIYSFTIYNVIRKKWDYFEYTKFIVLIISYTVLFFPVIRQILCCVKK